MEEKAISGRIPIVALSANDSDWHKNRSQEIGMKGYMVKPLMRDPLIKVMNKNIDAEKMAYVKK